MLTNLTTPFVLCGLDSLSPVPYADTVYGVTTVVLLGDIIFNLKRGHFDKITTLLMAPQNINCRGSKLAITC